MKIPASSQIKTIDAFTIAHEPISSVELMERAAKAVFDWLLVHLPLYTPVKVLAGSGNNGGDALVVARLLALSGVQVECFLFNFAQKLSPDCAFEKEKLEKSDRVSIQEITNHGSLPPLEASDWVIDGLFGTGLNRPLGEEYHSLVEHVNNCGATIVSIDIPSGLFGENNRDNDLKKCIQADYTLTFQFPKLSFLLPENAIAVGEWQILTIGLHPEAIEETITQNYFIEIEEVAAILKPRAKFAHKGTFGHALLVGGSEGKMGAMVLSARAALHSGVGLLSVHVPRKGNDILQIAVPEAITQLDTGEQHIFHIHVDEKIKAIAVGCGMGVLPDTAKAFEQLLKVAQRPLVVDADGLNLLSQHPEWLALLPTDTVLTPHPLEFDRLAGSSTSGYERLAKAREFAIAHRVVLVLKGAYTAVINPQGDAWFNSSGNPGMATGGSGDTLTGIILALLAQGYTPFDAARLGVYVHGLAGDIAVRTIAEESLTAGGIIEKLGIAFKELHQAAEF